MNPFAKSNSNFVTFSKAIVPLVVSALFSLSSTPLLAGGKSRSGSATRGNGKQSSFQQNVARDKKTSTRDTTWTNERGTGETSAVRERNIEDRSVTKERTTTTAGGAEFSSTGSAKANGDGTVSTTSTHTGPQGNTVTKTGTATKTDEGISASGTYETSTGKSGSYQTSAVKTENGAVSSTTVTNSKGETAEAQTTIEREGNQMFINRMRKGFQNRVREGNATVTVESAPDKN